MSTTELNGRVVEQMKRARGKKVGWGLTVEREADGMTIAEQNRAAAC